MTIEAEAIEGLRVPLPVSPPYLPIREFARGKDAVAAIAAEVVGMLWILLGSANKSRLFQVRAFDTIGEVVKMAIGSTECKKRAVVKVFCDVQLKL